MKDDLVLVIIEPDDHPVVSFSDLLDGLGQDDHGDVFCDQILQDLQVTLERVALESLGSRKQDQLGVIGRLASGIKDLIRDLSLAEGSRFIP